MALAEQPTQADRPGAALLAAIVSRLPAYEDSASPLYIRLSRTIRGLIESGALRGAEALPSERELVRATGLSRITVRNAIEDLAREGLISRRQGAGTYVSPQIDQPLSILMGFTADMKRRGASTSSIMIAKTVGLPDPDEMLKLGISPAEEVLRLSRVRCSAGEPLAMEHAVVPANAVRPEDIGDSLYDALRLTGNMPVRALQRLRAATADPDEARHLGVPRGSAILHIERRSFLPNGRPIEITKSAYRGDRYDFIAELRIEG